MSMYTRADRRCETCHRFPDFTGQDMLHWRSCVRKLDWPVFTTITVEKPQADLDPDCECGWTIPENSQRPKAALGLHRAKSRIHQEGKVA
jgi:hypothetical protein